MSLKAKQVGLRSSVTRRIKKLNDSIKDKDVRDCHVNFDLFRETVVNLKVCNNEVIEYLKDEEIEQEIEKQDQYSETIIRTIRDVEEFFNSLNETPQSISNLPTPVRLKVKLPEITIKPFGGDILEFKTFLEQFNASIGSNELSKIDKFSYLKSLLRGSAADTITGLPLTSENYEHAMDLLINRYGKPSVQIQAHMAQLLQIQPLQRDDCAPLRKSLDQLAANVRGLESLGIQGDAYRALLIPILLSRLPDIIRLQWAKMENSEEGTVDNLLTFLRREVESREFVVRNQRDFGGKINSYHHKTPSLANYTAPGCVLCKLPHPIYSCETFLQSNDKEKLVKNNRLCFNCLSPGHIVKVCKSKSSCKECGKRHHTRLHRSSPARKDSTSNGDLDPSLNAMVTTNTHIVLQTALINLKGLNNSKITCRVIFDTGSNRSYIKTKLSKQLAKRIVGSELINHATFGGQVSKSTDSRVIRVEAYTSSNDIIGLELLETNNICVPLYKQPVNLSCPQLRNLQLADTTQGGMTDIEILIGLDLYWNLMKTNIVKCANGVVAQDSAFGYILSGRSKGKSMRKYEQCDNSLLTLSESDDVRNMWNLESIGIVQHEKPVESVVLREYSKLITYDGERYEAPLLWKREYSPPMDNITQAYSRLHSLESKFVKDTELQDRYSEIINDLEASAIVEEIPKEELCKSKNEKVFYLPHHAVFKSSSNTTKIRPVFDGSMRSNNGISLNDCLESGPNLLPDLVSVLLRFRRFPIVVVADIKKAFLQIKLKKEDKDLHRFLWRKNGVIKHLRFNRVTFGVKCSPFMLNAVIKKHLGVQSNSQAIENLKQNLYVDDFLGGADTVKEALEIYEETCRIMKSAGMHFREWSSNSSELLDKLGTNSVQDVRILEGNETKLLGVTWNRESDTFVLTTGELFHDLQRVIPTKRVLLSTIAKIFDPLGLVNTCTIAGKILFQSVWRAGTDWDDAITPEHKVKWDKWIHSLCGIQNLTFQRQYFQTEIISNITDSIQFHVFADASEQAYGAVVYIQHNSSVYFVISRSRVAPIKTVSLPRLELLASLLATRLLSHVIKSLNLSNKTKYHYWTDSQVALAWIKQSPDKWKPFVRNRVIEIQENSDPSDWRHCPGISNPADCLTRDNRQNSCKEDLWHHGPSWLCNEKMWPKNETTIKNKSVVSKELRKSTTNNEIDPQSSLISVSSNPLMAINKFSNYTKLLGVTSYVFRALERMKRDFSNTGALSSEEINKAELYWLKHEQIMHYPDDYYILHNKGTLKNSSKLSKLTPLWDTKMELIRIGSRLEFANLPYDTVHRILIPNNSHLVQLILSYLHKNLRHCGVAQLLTAFNERFYVSGLRRHAKRVKSNCVTCRRYDQTACNEVASPLPPERVNPSPPFYVTGIDHCGPFTCKKSRLKHYICLFTCATTRAIHLELADSLTTEEFLLCFTRFICRRGIPHKIISDNGTTFVKASKDPLLTSKRIEWSFIVPRAPWWGGFWERMIRTVKTTLRKTLGGNTVTKREFSTLLCEVEFIVNNRPLTYVSEDLDAPLPLTPSHFLLGKTSFAFSDSKSNNEVVTTAQQLRGRKLHVDKVLNHFWKRWQKEYLLSLPNYVPNFKQNNNIDIGAIVLIREDNVSRSQWKLGRVTEIMKGRDGRVRSASLRTSSGTCHRPIQRLYLMEM